VPRVEADWQSDEKLSDDRLGEPSAAIRERVEAARERQRRRLEGTALLTNADMGPAEVRLYCPLDDACARPGTGGTEPVACGNAAAPRGHPDECAGVSPHPETGADDCGPFATIRAGLAGSEKIQTVHPSTTLRTGLAEAIQYRPRRQS